MNSKREMGNFFLFFFLPIAAVAEMDDLEYRDPQLQFMARNPSSTSSNASPSPVTQPLSFRKTVPAKTIVEGNAAKEKDPEDVIPTLQETLLIKTDFEFNNIKKQFHAERVVHISDLENRTWIGLTRPREGIVLLGRIVSHTKDVITMEYLVVDSNSDDSIFSTPPIKLPLGQRTTINLDNSTNKITVSQVTKYR